MREVNRALVGLLVLAPIACQLALGLEEPRGVPRVDAGRVVVDPCVHAPLPPRPARANAGADSGPGYWMLMTDIAFPLAERGFDLDSACTCSRDLHDGGAPCATPSGPARCDADGGIDNTFATELDPAIVAADLSGSTNAAIAMGTTGVLLYLTAYNGEPDDDEVGVILLPAAGMFSSLGCDEAPRPGVEEPVADPFAKPLPPLDDGCDHWRPKDGLLSGKPGDLLPTAGFASGYVSGRRLVTTGRTTVLPLGGRVIEAGEGALMGTLEPVTIAGRRAFRLVDGVAAGRSAIGALAGAFAGTPSAEAGSPALCKEPQWPRIRRSLCAALDTRSSPESDFAGLTCDAFSLTWGFRGQPVLLDVALRKIAPEGAIDTCDPITTAAQLCADP